MDGDAPGAFELAEQLTLVEQQAAQVAALLDDTPQVPTGLGVLFFALKISPSCDIHCTVLKPMISKKTLAARM